MCPVVLMWNTGKIKQNRHPCDWDARAVRVKGLEPPRITPPDPKSGAAANYAIPALDCKGIIFPAICNYPSLSSLS